MKMPGVIVAGLGIMAVGAWGCAVEAEGQGAERAEPVEWDYKVISTIEIMQGANARQERDDANAVESLRRGARAIEDRLDQLGEQGWELVEVNQGALYLKRRARQADAE